MPIVESNECYANHMGPWLMETRWLSNAVNAINAGAWQAREHDDEEELRRMRRLNVQDGVAMIPVAGPMMKERSKFGGTSTILTRRLVREAASTDRVKAIMLHIESPGGSVDGTQELAHEVARANAAKPVFAHIADIGASAAYWVASQARRITANQTASVGSIGVVGVIEDSSKAAEEAGFTVHVISSGEFKGAGAPGTEITQDMLDHWQAIVDGTHEIMASEIASGRRMSRRRVDESADGRVFLSDDALQRGLIDGVADFDEAFAAVVRQVKRDENKRNRRAREIDMGLT